MRFFKYTEKEDNSKTAAQSKKAPQKKSFGSFWAKVICVLAALLVWFYVSGEQSPTFEKTFYNIAVNYDGMASLEKQGYTIISGNNPTVDVTVSGKRTEVNNIGKDDITASADLSGIYGPGEYTLTLSVATPGNTSSKTVNPESVVVYVDKSSQKEIPVVATVVSGGTTELSIKIEDPVPAYETVRVTGPDEELAEISHAAIDIALEGLVDSSVEYTGQLYLVDKNGNTYSSAYVKTDKTRITVMIPVNKYKTVPVEVAYSGDSADVVGYDTELSLKNVEIRGNADVIDAISSVKTENIDLSKITGNTGITTELAVPPGAQLVDESQSTVTVFVSPRTSNNASVITSNIALINIPAGLSARIDEKSKTFSFSGSIGEVSKLTSTNVYAVADLSPYTAAGTYDVKLEVHYDDNLHDIKLIGDYYCKVTLYK